MTTDTNSSDTIPLTDDELAAVAGGVQKVREAASPVFV